MDAPLCSIDFCQAASLRAALHRRASLQVSTAHASGEWEGDAG